MTDWNWIVEGFECHAKESGLEPVGSRVLQNFAARIPIATRLPPRPSTSPHNCGESTVF